MSGKQILEYVYERAAAEPDKRYMVQPYDGGKTTDYTWGETVDRARRFATWLKSEGYEPGDKVAILSKNCAHFIISELGIWMAGCVTVAIYPTVNGKTLSYILDHSDAKMIIVGKLDIWDELKDAVPADFKAISLPLAPPTDYPSFDSVIADQAPLEGNPSRPPEDLGIILYTSGSTGVPKGVMHSMGAMSAAAEGIVRELKIVSSDRGFSYLPLAHVFERAYVECASLVSGEEIFFAESLDTFVADLKRARPTLFISVPRLWLKFQLGVFKKMPPGKLAFYLKIPIFNNIVRKKVLTGLGLEHVRLAGSGSAPIPSELIAWYRSLGLNLLEGYAMSEDFAYSHLSTPEFSEPGYVGVPYKEVKVKLSDEGEILIKSPGAMMGYYKQPELSAECFDDEGYFKTGDRGARKANGLLKITGRVKELFKSSKGKYIAPAPIENIINNHPSVELSCVSGSGQPQPFALVQAAEDLRPKLGDPSVKAQLEAELTELLAEVNGKVEHHEHLQFMALVSETWDIAGGFLTPTMKIKRSVIEDTYKDKVEGWYEEKNKVVWG